MSAARRDAVEDVGFRTLYAALIVSPDDFWGNSNNARWEVKDPHHFLGGGVKTKKRTEISLETNQVFVVRSHRKKVQAWCPKCGESVSMVTADEAGIVTGVSTRAIYRWVEDGKLHFTETAEGFLLICSNSLS